MRQQSPIPGHMIRDSRWGHRVAGHEEAISEADAKDREFVAKYSELAASYNLHVEVGAFSHEGPPYFAAILPDVIYERLVGPQENGGSTAARLGWGALLRLPGYADGQLSRREAIEQARVNYDAAQNGSGPCTGSDTFRTH